MIQSNIQRVSKSFCFNVLLFIGLIFLSGALFGQEEVNDSTLNDAIRTEFIENIKKRIQDSVFIRSLLITPEILSDVPEGVDKDDYLKELDKWIVVYDRWNFATHVDISRLAKSDSVYLIKESGKRVENKSKYIPIVGELDFKAKEFPYRFWVRYIKFKNAFYIDSIYIRYKNMKIDATSCY